MITGSGDNRRPDWGTWLDGAQVRSARASRDGARTVNLVSRGGWRKRRDRSPCAGASGGPADPGRRLDAVRARDGLAGGVVRRPVPVRLRRAAPERRLAYRGGRSRHRHDYLRVACPRARAGWPARQGGTRPGCGLRRRLGGDELRRGGHFFSPVGAGVLHAAAVPGGRGGPGCGDRPPACPGHAGCPVALEGAGNHHPVRAAVRPGSADHGEGSSPACP